MSTGFLRARTADQRTQRQEHILGVATAMLQEMPVAELSLNELSRRVGLAKSNVIRYFETREAVLLTLLEREAALFLDDLRGALPAADPSAPADERCRVVAAAVASCFDARPMLCDLLGHQSAALERNVSVEVARTFKRGARDHLLGLAATLRRHLPELDDRRAAQVARTVVVLAGALWTQSHPAPTVQAAIAADPELSFFATSFPDAMRSTVGTFLAGALAATGRPDP